MSYSATPYASGEDAGLFYSEGRIVSFLESELVHPEHTDGLVDKNDPVICPGGIVGVAMDSATATTSLIAVDTQGVYSLPVIASSTIGTQAIAKGDPIVIDAVSGVLAYGRLNGMPFGIALAAATASASAVNIPVLLGQEGLSRALTQTERVLATGALKVRGTTILDSAAGAIAGTLAAGHFPGQRKTIVMEVATNSSTVSIANHVTSDPEVATFDAIDETLELLWTGTEWATVHASATFV